MKFNKRLLSEILCHPDFQRMMLDTEIFVDQIADMRINDMNAVLEAVRQIELAKRDQKDGDVYLRTLELAQVSEDEYFGHVIYKDLTDILRDIRDAHKTDPTTADQTSVVAEYKKSYSRLCPMEAVTRKKWYEFSLPI